ncbi:OB-fold domain-containing protein [Metapseudomonas lalkuanensis]|uniref:OB-fold domain-containing protein n=1 Tax=Metapseudomonas lalkuanensis TaxID=2604832 RepID=A0A5J6QL33_9GAMM|nr:OB-fold domain-containing protein [Pseudomonas lalkuanensis]QEY63280.1 OB-fold domain-containing protein [Pseudomonas lalkuanensis]UCP00650.1 OB-fold domain-containing protein [Pseudomonas lalkuanensis]
MNPLPSLWGSDSPWRLLGSRHIASGELVFPPLSSHSPLAAQYRTEPLAAEGSLYSFTIIHPSPKSGLVPFALGYLDLEGPVRLFGRISGSERPVIGGAYRVLPDETYGYVFESVEASQ